MRVLPEGVLIDTDNLAGFSLFEKEFFQAVEDDDTARLGIDLLENLYGLLGLAFPDQDFTNADVGWQERPVFLDGASEVPPCLIRVTSFQQLTSYLVCATGEEMSRGLTFRLRQIGLQETMLDFERFAPFFESDQEIALADERGQVIRFDLEHLVQGLQGIFIALGTLQVVCQLQQNFDVAVVDTIRSLVKANRLGEVAFCAVNVSQPQQ